MANEQKLTIARPSLPDWVSSLPEMGPDSEKTLPEGVSLTAISAAYEKIETDLTPVSAQQLGLIMDRVMRWGRAFHVKGDREALTAVYQDDLGHLPGWALDAAVSRTLQAQEYTSFPLPAAVLNHLPSRYREIQHIRARLWKAKFYGREWEQEPDAPRATVEQMQQIAKRTTAAIAIPAPQNESERPTRPLHEVAVEAGKRAVIGRE